MTGGPAGAQAVAQLVQLTPAPPDVVAGWDRDPRTRRAAAAAGAAGAADLDELYAQLYPSDERAAVELERRERAQLRRAERFDPAPFDNTLTTAAAPGTDEALYRALFGRPGGR